MSNQKISFIASLPDLQTAINIGGDGSTRIKLDIPESELAGAVKLILLKGMAFRVTIEPLNQKSKYTTTRELINEKETNKSKKTNRKSG